MKTLKILSERVFKAGYVLRKELIESPCKDEPPMEWTMAYSLDGDYIGSSKDAHRLCIKRGIRPQTIGPSHTVCSIGFSFNDGKWYGWSHRAIFGFKIGSTCKKADCHYQPSNKREFLVDCGRFWDSDGHEDVHARFVTEDGVSGVYVAWKYSKDIPNKKLRSTISGIFTAYPSEWGQGEWTAKTVANAKQMAIDFARGVS